MSVPPVDSIQTLLFETSPFGNLDAVVEHDSRAIYFYLNGAPDFGTRACWVGNLKVGPLALNEREMLDGIPPLLPRIHCCQPTPRIVPRPDDLRIVWFPQGNGAAVLERNEVLAVIPPWSGKDGFHGYARDCISENPICWPLPNNPALLEQIARADKTWSNWRTQPVFRDLQLQQLKSYENWFGDRTQYFAIDGGRFPPRGLGQFSDGIAITLATVGMSLVPQPNVEMYLENPNEYRRVELACRIPNSFDADVVSKFRQAISGLAAAPWRRWLWLGPGHTCNCDLGTGLQQVLLVETPEFGVCLPNVEGDPVRFLFVAPLTASQFARKQSGESEESLQKELMQSGYLHAGGRPAVS